MASPPTTFHCFRKLPAECQLMIWTFYRDARCGTRHCFSVDGNTLLYAALSSGNFSLFDNMARGVDGVDDWTQARPYEPFEAIKPANKALVLAHLAHPSIIFKHTKGSMMFMPAHLRDRAVRRPTAPHIWVNFTEDVFYFDWCHDNSPSFLWSPSWFRALHPGRDDPVPRALKNDHWLFKVQKLALRVGSGLDWGQLEIPILKRMTQLKLLQLVIRIDCSEFARTWKADQTVGAWDAEARWPDDVFIPHQQLDRMDIASVAAPDAQMHSELWHVRRRSDWHGWQKTRAEAVRFASELRTPGISAKIDLVLHIC
ncbi:hypothetical protein LQW54_008404 [Pestalotiopsis sp. IQ-011]